MKSWCLVLMLVGVVIGGDGTAQAQFFGGGYFGGFGGFGYGGGGYGFGNGSSMGNFAPPHSVGGYYPVPYSTIFPGYVGNGFNASPFGAGPINYGPYGNGGYDYVGSNGYGGFDAYGRVPTYFPAQQPAVTSYSAAIPANPQVIRTGAPIKLVCPKAAASGLSYSLNGTIFTIQPGYSQNFRDDRTWKLEFHRGGEESEVATYTLKPGTYNFAVGASGWELRQVVSVSKEDQQPPPQPTPLPETPPEVTPASKLPTATAPTTRPALQTSKVPLPLP